MHELFSELKELVVRTVQETAGTPGERVAVEYPPDPTLGDLATPAALGLARLLRRPPREIAQKLAEALAALPGVAGAEVAGPGYVNLRIDRTAAVRRLLTPIPSREPSGGKVIVEHTNINPNKAAHIGHLRNAVLGDTLVRALGALGRQVEVQNYIDDTGVQVADVAVALHHLAHCDEAGFQSLLDRAESRRAAGGHGVDHDLWDLYSQVTRWYDEDPARKEIRTSALHDMEGGHGPIGKLGRLIARAVVRCHLRTMGRIGVDYHVLPKESDILSHHFWLAAFERLKASGAITLQTEGKAAGCWVMNLPHSEEDDAAEEYEKIIVRSNGVVTYVGKDIAYQLWKFGLLGRDFDYAPFPGASRSDGTQVWETTAPGHGQPDAPAFGRGETVYNVIDVRQSYLQRVVRQGLERLGHTAEASRSIHFAYEMVALTPDSALLMQPGLVLSEEERNRPWVDMSGRRGIGIKADDLIDRLEERARHEVETRNPDRSAADRQTLAREIAVGALRYYMLRFARNTVVAFDLDDALSFEGETGPYCQYALVRIARIIENLAERTGRTVEAVRTEASAAAFSALPTDLQPSHWALVHLAAQLPDVVRQAVENLEFSALAKYAFQLAQEINGFYHKYRVLQEPEPEVRAARLAVLLTADSALRQTLAVMGVPVPERM